MNEEAGEGGDDADRTDEDAGVPESLFVGQQGDGADDQRDFQNALASIESVGTLAEKVALSFELLRFVADLVFVAGIAL